MINRSFHVAPGLCVAFSPHRPVLNRLTLKKKNLKHKSNLSVFNLIFFQEFEVNLPENGEEESEDHVSKFEEPFLLFPIQQVEDLCHVYQMLSFRVTNIENKYTLFDIRISFGQ